MFFYGNNCHYFTKIYFIVWTMHCPFQDICMVICFTGYCFWGIRKRLLYTFVIEKIYSYIHFLFVPVGKLVPGAPYSACSGDGIRWKMAIKEPAYGVPRLCDMSTARSISQGILPFCCFLAAREKLSCDVVQSLWLKKRFSEIPFFIGFFCLRQRAANCRRRPLAPQERSPGVFFAVMML